MLYATVASEKSLPFRRGRGFCPSCGGAVRAKCGAIYAHHWAHESGQECDTWSEGIGPWHLSWQSLVRPEFSEVPLGDHRADILGDDDTVIELQHSPIGPEEIRARERFYGKMLWLIDAAARFPGLASGPRYFFSLGRNKHLAACRRPVFLDFHDFLVEVEAVTDLFPRFSGFGLIRSRRWFIDNRLSARRRPGPPPARFAGPERRASFPRGKSPWRLTRHASRWLEPNGRVTTYPEGTPFLQPSHGAGKRAWPAWWDIIAQHPPLAHGWTQGEMRDMLTLLGGVPIVLGGLLRLMPNPASEMPAPGGADLVVELLQRADAHIKAGRLPVLKDETRASLLESARQRGTTRAGDFLERVWRADANLGP